MGVLRTLLDILDWVNMVFYLLTYVVLEFNLYFFKFPQFHDSCIIVGKWTKFNQTWPTLTIQLQVDAVLDLQWWTQVAVRTSIMPELWTWRPKLQLAWSIWKQGILCIKIWPQGNASLPKKSYIEINDINYHTSTKLLKC